MRGGQEARPLLRVFVPGARMRRFTTADPKTGDTPLMSSDQRYPREPVPPAAGVQLNHTAIYASDRRLSAEFIAAILA